MHQQPQSHLSRSHFRLGYWPVRGRAQIIRHLLSYLNLPFIQTLYQDSQRWFSNDKYSLQIPFPNLPYLIETSQKQQQKKQQFKLTQTHAICKYLISSSSKPQLLGNCLQDQVKVTMLYNLVMDICTQSIELFYDKQYQQKVNKIFDKIKPKLEYLNQYIVNRSTCLQYLTYVDFVIAEFIGHYLMKLYGDKCQMYHFIKNIKQYVQNLEGVKKYYQRQNAVKQPHVSKYIAAIMY